MIIQHLKSLFLKCQIHPLTLLYLIFAWFGGYLKWYLSCLFIVCIHELCHLMMAYYFQFQIDKIEILPFGAYLTLKDFYFHPIEHEMCVVLAGPCCHLLLHICILHLTKGVFQDYLLNTNLYIFLFNIMPVYPLDGSRFICLILQSLIDLKKALYFHLKISVFALIIFTIFYLKINTFVIICYLYLQQGQYMKFIPHYLRLFYSQIPTFSQNRKILIHHHLEYRRGYLNYYEMNGNILGEDKIMFQLLESVKLK